jgi:hypothetical protein
VVSRTDANTYGITWLSGLNPTGQVSVTSTATFTPKADAGYALGVLITTPYAVTDTYKLTYNAVESGLITHESDATVAIQAALDALSTIEAGDVVITRTDANTYVATWREFLNPTLKITVTSATTFTPKADAGYTTGSIISTPYVAPDTFKISTDGAGGAKTAAISTSITGSVTATAMTSALNTVLGAASVTVASTDQNTFVVTVNDVDLDLELLAVTDATTFAPKADAGYTDGVIQGSLGAAGVTSRWQVTLQSR